MSKTLGCAIALYAVWLASPVIVAADSVAAPVRVTDCTVIAETISRRGGVPQTIRVSFSNENDTPADVARFTAKAPAGVVREFTARGRFAKGIVLSDRVLRADQRPPNHALKPCVECMLTYVHFVDGSQWTAPQ